MSMSILQQTLHTRHDGHLALAAMADLFSRVERGLHAELQKGRRFTGDLAKTFYQPFGISAKNLDMIRRQLKGKLSAVREGAKARLMLIEIRITDKNRSIVKAEKRLVQAQKTIENELGKKKGPNESNLNEARKKRDKIEFALHQHKRRLQILKEQKIETERQITDPSLCFGSAKLFNAQHHLEENGYANHQEWLKDWQAARASQFFVEGDAQYEGGNQFVRLFAREDGLFDLELRLPQALTPLSDETVRIGGSDIPRIMLRGLSFPFGADAIRHALQERQPLSFRFLKDETSWRIFVSVERTFAEPKVKNYRNGALGIDVNIDHIAAALTDIDGNVVRTWRIPLITHSKSEGQRLDAVRQAAAEAVKIALEYAVPIVAEKLDFSVKRAQLESETSRRRARQLSSFAYSAFGQALTSACIRHSVHLVRVNPAYTSLIGRLKFARRYGLSVHAAAALSIARRGMGLSERLPSSLEVSLDSGDRVTLARPARIGRRHVWSLWRRVAKEWNAVRAEHARARREAGPAVARDGKPDPAAARQAQASRASGRWNSPREVELVA